MRRGAPQRCAALCAHLLQAPQSQRCLARGPLYLEPPSFSACAAVAAAAGVTIDAGAVSALAARLKPDEVAAAARGGFPVRFESVEAEVSGCLGRNWQRAVGGG